MIEYTLAMRCRKLADVPPGATVTIINGKYVVGRCGVCSGYVTEAQDYDIDEEGGDIFHRVCPRKGVKR
jgi:hypothetical protein